MRLPWHPLVGPHTALTVLRPRWSSESFLSSTEILSPDFFLWLTSVFPIRCQLHDTDPALVPPNWCCPHLRTQKPLVILCCVLVVSALSNIRNDLISLLSFGFSSLQYEIFWTDASFFHYGIFSAENGTWHFERDQLLFVKWMTKWNLCSLQFALILWL